MNTGRAAPEQALKATMMADTCLRYVRLKGFLILKNIVRKRDTTLVKGIIVHIKNNIFLQNFIY